MNEGQRAALRARGQEFLRTFFGVAEGSRDLIDAVGRILEPSARVHLQNGDIAGPEFAQAHSASTSRVFPDLEVEFREALMPDDRVVVRVRMTGTSSGRTPFAPKGGAVDVTGALIARITPRLTVSEFWPYLNPGFSLAFPPRGVRLQPPAPDSAGEQAARTLYDGWVRGAEAGKDFVSSVADMMAADGVVHLGNGDITRADGLDELFARIAFGLHDLTIEIEDVMFDGPFVVSPLRMSGVHRGPIGMFPPTGRVLPSTGLLLARADATGRAAEVWLHVAPGYAALFPPTRR